MGSLGLLEGKGIWAIIVMIVNFVVVVLVYWLVLVVFVVIVGGLSTGGEFKRSYDDLTS